MKFIGQKLRTLRKSQNLTLTNLEEKTGIRQGALSSIENEVKNPKFTTVGKIADALGVAPQYFYIVESRLPTELLPDMDDELREFLFNEKNMPYIVLSKEAEANGISPEALENVLRALIQAKGKKK